MMQNIDESELIKLLSKFECDKDEDIQNFITNKEKAIQYERLQKARTYILFDENQIKEETIENLDILGYISLATKVLSVPDEVSNRFRKEIDGLSAKIHGQRINEFSTYLIGQLGRNSRFKSEELPGKVLLDYADSVISVAMNSVGGRATLIECKNDSKLINFYSEN